MKTPRWFIWLTLGYAVYNLFTISLHLAFPALNDYTNNSVLTLAMIMACVMLSVSLFYLIMFIYFIIKKAEKHSLWLSGLQLFDVFFTTVGALILQILLTNNSQLSLTTSNLLGALIPAVMLIYCGVLLVRK